MPTWLIAWLLMHWRYFRSVLKHKRFVYQEGRKLGLSVWQCAIHDWSKFTPRMWVPYAQAFYGARRGCCVQCDTPLVGGKELPGRTIWPYCPNRGCVAYAERTANVSYRKTGKPNNDAAFDAAWLWHQQVERHHWQGWVLMEDSGKVHCLPMPERYMREMLADWHGANRAYGDQPLTTWYIKTAAARKLHPETRDWIEAQLGIGFCDECNRLAPLSESCAGRCGLKEGA